VNAIPEIHKCNIYVALLNKKCIVISNPYNKIECVMKFLIRLLYLPLFTIGGNAIAIAVVSQGHSKLWLVVLLITFIAIAFLLERAAPFDKTFNQSRGDSGRDFLHALVNESLGILSVLSFPLLVLFNPLPSVWPDTLPLWGQLLLAVFIVDIGITLAHFVSHRINVLWQLHAVHHSVQRMYGFNGLMKHPLHQLIETVAGTTPLLLMGIPQDVLMLLLVAVGLQLLLQHSNVAYFTGPFKHLLAVNVVHRFHHINNAKEGDVNFGLFTQFTDYFLGTRYYDSVKKITIANLGIEDEPNYPSAYLQQLMTPFRGYDDPANEQKI